MFLRVWPLVAVALLSSPAASAEPDEVKVSIAADNQSLDVVLKELSRQAGWDLVLESADVIANRRISLTMTNRSAGEVLAALRRVDGIRVDLDGGILTVSPRPTGTWGDPEDDDDADKGQGLDLKISDDARVAVGGSVVVEHGERVPEAVVVGGTLTVRGTVARDAVVVGGKLVVEPSGVVGRDVVVIGGKADVQPGATVRGNRVALGETMGGAVQWLSGLTQNKAGPLLLAVWSVLGTLLRLLALLVVGTLLVAFAPERLERVRQLLITRPGAATAAGLALLVGFVPFCLVLVVTLIGIPLVPIAAALFALLLATGATVLMVTIGSRLPLLAGRKSLFVSMLLGAAVLMLIDLVPFVGTVTVVLASFVAAGAVLLSRLGADRSRPAAV